MLYTREARRERAPNAVMAAGLLVYAIGLPGAQAQDADLAKKLSNPIAALISVPFQINYDQNVGVTDEGERYTLNIQPVIPVSISSDWNLISRTIIPVIWQHDTLPPFDSSNQHNLGDTVQSLFLSPKRPGPNGIIASATLTFLFPIGGA
jgi:hypothetical protein